MSVTLSPSVLVTNLRTSTALAEAVRKAVPAIAEAVDAYVASGSPELRGPLIAAVTRTLPDIVPRLQELGYSLHVPSVTHGGQSQGFGVVEIPDTEEAYMTLMQERHRSHMPYRGISVCPAGEGKVRVYFY